VLLFTGRHFWNRKCRKKTWWQQEFAVFKCEATVNSVTGHVCVNSNTQVNMAALDKGRQAVTNRRPRTENVRLAFVWQPFLCNRKLS